ncbi:hypothetical protein PR048_025009 [Dryococelus australis]|uniref:Uncharacterized protein n=1 Tax=Dryococelus australis TaxID=614101 RepID=A0ABQ9GQ51_9NEOP|nr:hypothetical protein PR048_025009 [Dryococelus australis]
MDEPDSAPSRCNYFPVFHSQVVARPNRARFSTGLLPDFRTWGLCRWLAGFLGDLPFTPTFHYGAASYSPQFILIGSQDLDVKSRPNLSTPLNYFGHALICDPRSNVGTQVRGETGDPRENPLTSGIVRLDSYVRNSDIDPAGNRTRDWMLELSSPTMVNRVSFQEGPIPHCRIWELCPGRCYWSAGFLGDSPYSPPLPHRASILALSHAHTLIYYLYATLFLDEKFSASMAICRSRRDGVLVSVLDSYQGDLGSIAGDITRILVCGKRGKHCK